VVVSSDDEEVLDIAASFGDDLPLRRPGELATATSPAIDFIAHALAALDEPVDAVALVQPTSPFTLPSDIDACIDLLERSGADSVVTVVRLDHTIQPAKLKVLDGDRLVPYLEDEGGRMAEHELPEIYVRNGSVYASRRAVHDAGRPIGDDCRAVVMPRGRSLDINDELDLAVAEVLLARQEGGS
jgi:CMP-N-acetylneuraminic acid synthetase